MFVRNAIFLFLLFHRPVMYSMTPTPTLSMVVGKEESLKQIQRMCIYRPTVNISMYAKSTQKTAF